MSGQAARLGFTLAEVLITLGIIGVVAAMTIPSIINKTNKKELQTSFKAAYSILSQAVSQVVTEEGGNLRKTYVYTEPIDSTSSGVWYPNNKLIADKLYSKLKVIGECNYTGSVRTFNKSSDSPQIDRGTVKPNRALANGMCFNVGMNAGQINLTIDTNGTKGPNILGYDIFYFDIDDSDKLRPKQASSHIYTEDELENIFGTNYSDSLSAVQYGDPCSLNSNQAGNGLGCAYYALIDQNPDDKTKGYWESLR